VVGTAVMVLQELLTGDGIVAFWTGTGGDALLPDQVDAAALAAAATAGA